MKNATQIQEWFNQFQLCPNTLSDLFKYLGEKGIDNSSYIVKIGKYNSDPFILSKFIIWFGSEDEEKSPDKDLLDWVKNAIAWKFDGNTVTIWNKEEYAPYVEKGCKTNNIGEVIERLTRENEIYKLGINDLIIYFNNSDHIILKRDNGETNLEWLFEKIKALQEENKHYKEQETKRRKREMDDLEFAINSIYTERPFIKKPRTCSNCKNYKERK